MKQTEYSAHYGNSHSELSIFKFFYFILLNPFITLSVMTDPPSDYSIYEVSYMHLCLGPGLQLSAFPFYLLVFRPLVFPFCLAPAIAPIFGLEALCPPRIRATGVLNCFSYLKYSPTNENSMQLTFNTHLSSKRRRSQLERRTW